MKLERIQTIQRLPIQIEEAWDFFTSPKNLRLITPHWLDFRLTMEPPEYLHPGTIVCASIRPVPAISTDWISEITQIRPPHFYITEQRFGPFKMWHHEHHFRSHEEGVEIEDIILYGMHFGMIGSFAHNLFIRKKLHEAFSFRAQALEQRFGTISKTRPVQNPAPALPPGFKKQAKTPSNPQLQERLTQQAKPGSIKQQPVQPSAEDAQPRRPQSVPQQQPKPAQDPPPTPGKPVPQIVTLDDIFRGTDD